MDLFCFTFFFFFSVLVDQIEVPVKTAINITQEALDD